MTWEDKSELPLFYYGYLNDSYWGVKSFAACTLECVLNLRDFVLFLWVVSFMVCLDQLSPKLSYIDLG